MCTCIYVYMHMCIHAYMFQCVHVYLCSCIHAYMAHAYIPSVLLPAVCEKIDKR